MQSLIKIAKPFIERQHFLFSIGAFLIFLIAAGYLGLINHPPDFNHVWRQSDSVSLVKNYYHGGMNFFEPQTYNLVSNDGTTGHATSEMPYLYYLVAGLQHLFGEEFWVYRLTWILILVFGFASFYLFALQWLKSKLVSFLLSILVFSSPLIIFYGNNFIPDVPSLCFAFAGWYFFSKYYFKKESEFLWLTSLFFVLAGLLKATAMLSFFALAGVWALELLGLKLGEGKKRVFENSLKSAIPFVIGFGIVAAWYLWAWRYNQTHGTFLFSMQTHPLWRTNQIEPNLIARIFQEISMYHLKMIHSNAFLVSLVAAFVGVLAFFRKTNKALLTIMLLLFFGVASIFVLWFTSLYYHDYYFIIMLVFPPFVFIASLEIIIRKLYHKRWAKTSLLAVLAFLMVFSVGHALKMQSRSTAVNSQLRGHVISLVPLLDDLGIETNDRIISLPDPTPNFSLTTLNRKGWSGFAGANNLEDFKKRLQYGAKYLIIADFEQTMARRPFLADFLNEPMGKIGQTKVFRIDGKPATRFLYEKVDTVAFVFNGNVWMGNRIDSINFDGHEMVDGSLDEDFPNMKFPFGFELVKTDPENQFALDSRTPIGQAQFATIKVLRKGSPASLVVSSQGSKSIYVSKANGFPIEGSEWEEIVINISLDGFKPSDILIAYGWNHTDAIAYFANIEVILFTSSSVVVEKKPDLLN